MKDSQKITAGIFLVFLAVPVFSASEWKLPQNEPKLKAGPGADLATANCLMCHSSDYVSTQPPLDRTAWKAIVQKMREKYGAPFTTNNIDPLVDYLYGKYGKK